MESSQNFELVGGITDVVIYPAGAPLPEAVGELTADALPIAIAERSSKYSEEWSCRSSSRAIHHTLQYVTTNDQESLSQSEIEAAMLHGVVADVTLASGANIRVGLTYTLRLKSVSFTSGTEPTDTPQRVWVWECTDTTPLL